MRRFSREIGPDMAIGFRIPPALSAIVTRYAAIVIQFGLTILITQRTDNAVAGQYFIVFGWVTSTSFLAGLGLPDGLVREVSHVQGIGEHRLVRPIVRAAAIGFAAITFALALAGMSAAVWLGVAPEMAGLVLGWWLCYATTFFCAQALVALQRPEQASFFFYTAPTLALLLSLGPFLLLVVRPSIEAMLSVILLGAVPFAALAIGALILRLARGEWARGQPVPRGAVRNMMTLGMRIAAARVAQTALFWIPTWTAGANLSTVAASIIGLSGRLNNALAAIMASIRFVVRPGIVDAAARDDWAGIERNARLISSLVVPAIALSLIAYLIVGYWLIVFLFGANYGAAYPVLAILIVGTLAEGVGGVVDEILKMTGSATFVLALLVAVVACEAAAAWLVRDVLSLAAIQAGAIILLYAAQLAFFRKTRGVWLLPFHSVATIKAAFRMRGR
jgi:O-antigen/teichoic acid export membrane protein